MTVDQSTQISRLNIDPLGYLHNTRLVTLCFEYCIETVSFVKLVRLPFSFGLFHGMLLSSLSVPVVHGSIIFTFPVLNKASTQSSPTIIALPTHFQQEF